MKASPWDNGSKEPCPRTQRSGHSRIRTEDRLIRSLTVGGECLLSREGTTQGDPLAMGMYAVGIIPLIKELQGNGEKQLWYADDASDAGSLKQIRSWWDVLRTRGLSYGYFQNATKSWLLVKGNAVQQARALFEDSGINITIEGRRLIGVALRTEPFVTSFISASVTRLTHDQRLLRLAEFTKSQAHAAYVAYTHGLSSEWTFLTRVSPGIADQLGTLEKGIQDQLIPSLTGRQPPGDTERELLSMPVRLGGLTLCEAIDRFRSIATWAHSNLILW